MSRGYDVTLVTSPPGELDARFTAEDLGTSTYQRRRSEDRHDGSIPARSRAGPSIAPPAVTPPADNQGTRDEGPGEPGQGDEGPAGTGNGIPPPPASGTGAPQGKGDEGRGGESGIEGVDGGPIGVVYNWLNVGLIGGSLVTGPVLLFRRTRRLLELTSSCVETSPRSRPVG